MQGSWNEPPPLAEARGVSALVVDSNDSWNIISHCSPPSRQSHCYFWDSCEWSGSWKRDLREEAKIPGSEDQDCAWNRGAWPGEGGWGPCCLLWGNGNSDRLHSGLCIGLFLKPVACEYVFGFWSLGQKTPLVSLKRQPSAQSRSHTFSREVIAPPRGIGAGGSKKLAPLCIKHSSTYSM